MTDTDADADVDVDADADADVETDAVADRDADAATTAGRSPPPGRRRVAAEGEAVDGVPVLRRIPTESTALITITTDDVTAWCPYEGTADYYHLELAYQPDGYAIELMSYRDYLQTYRDETIGHEAFAKQVFEHLRTVLAPEWLRLDVQAPPRYGLETALRHQTGPMPADLRETV